MTYFKIIFFFLLLFISNKTLAQNKGYKMTFNEQFDDNKNNWVISNTEFRKSSIVSGKLIDDYHDFETRIVSLVKVNFNSEKNYVLKFSIANFNSEFKGIRVVLDPNYGFVWSFKDWKNYNYIIFEQVFVKRLYTNVLEMHYEIGSYVDGNEIIHREMGKGFLDSELKTDGKFNEITIHRSGNTLYFYNGYFSESSLTGLMEGTCPAEKWFSPYCGFLIEDTKIMVDYLTIEEKINEVEKNTNDSQTEPKLVTTSGSGIFVSIDGYIATNYHVVENGKDFKVEINEKGLKKTYNAELIKVDKQNDLAILKINDNKFKNIASLPYGIKSSGVRIGEKIFAMGYPMIGYQGNQVKVTDGIISSITGYQDDPTTYQISAPIQPGNSGGPLFDMKGNLIGITNAGIPDAQNVGYSIKITYLMSLLETIPSISKLNTQSKLIGKSFPDVLEKIKPYSVLIKVNEIVQEKVREDESVISSFAGGYFSNKLKDLIWDSQKNVWVLENEYNFRSELYLTEKKIGFKRGSNNWLGNKWTYVVFDNKQNIYRFYDERGQGEFLIFHNNL